MLYGLPGDLTWVRGARLLCANRVLQPVEGRLLSRRLPGSGCTLGEQELRGARVNKGSRGWKGSQGLGAVGGTE